MKILNVRLSPADAAAARRVRARGKSVSDVVRAAIRAEDARGGESANATVSEVLAEMTRLNPTPAAAPRSSVDTTNRAELRRHVVARLRRAR